MRAYHFSAFTFIAAAVGACTGAPDQHVRLGTLAFDVPGGWHDTRETRRGVLTAVWAPEDNARKESVTVIRSELAPNVAGAAAQSPALVAQLAEQAQAGLADARITPATTYTVASGLAGVRLDVEFVPPGLRERYHRVHIVLVDRTALVHVLYTARSAEANPPALGLVLRSLREEAS